MKYLLLTALFWSMTLNLPAADMNKTAASAKETAAASAKEKAAVPAKEKAAAPPAKEDDPVVAKVGTVSITRSQLLDAAKSKLAKIRNEEYEIQQQTLNDMINQMLLDQAAADRKKSVEELMKNEVEDKVPMPSLEEARAVYDIQPDKYSKMDPNVALMQIEQELWNRRYEQRRYGLLLQLGAEKNVQFLLKAPTLDIPLAKLPQEGPADAPVTIVEVSDFQCPYCFEAQGVIKQLKQQYGDKLHFAFINFPLSFHPNARGAAQAAYCAGQQGQFFAMHDLLFAGQEALQTDDLKRYAQQLGLNMDTFAACLSSDQAAKAVSADMALGHDLGVSSTPSFFINGRMVEGVQEYDVLSKIIDEEIARQGSSPAAAPPSTKR